MYRLKKYLMLHTVKIYNLQIQRFDLTDLEATIIINGHIECEELSLTAHSVEINHLITCSKIRIYAKSIIVNGKIIAKQEVFLNAQNFLKIFSIRSYFIHLTTNKLLIMSNLFSQIFYVTAIKAVFLASSVLYKYKFDIEDYMIKIKDLFSLTTDEFPYLITDKKQIEKALIEDFEIDKRIVQEILKNLML